MVYGKQINNIPHFITIANNIFLLKCVRTFFITFYVQKFRIFRIEQLRTSFQGILHHVDLSNRQEPKMRYKKLRTIQTQVFIIQIQRTQKIEKICMQKHAGPIFLILFLYLYKCNERLSVFYLKNCSAESYQNSFTRLRLHAFI